MIFLPVNSFHREYSMKSSDKKIDFYICLDQQEILIELKVNNTAKEAL